MMRSVCSPLFCQTVANFVLGQKSFFFIPCFSNPLKRSSRYLNIHTECNIMCVRMKVDAGVMNRSSFFFHSAAAALQKFFWMRKVREREIRFVGQVWCRRWKSDKSGLRSRKKENMSNAFSWTNFFFPRVRFFHFLSLRPAQLGYFYTRS